MKAAGRYRKGADAERERVRWHYARGAVYAARMAGSHSPFDVIAVYSNQGGKCDVFLEQVKSRKEKVRLPFITLPPNIHGHVVVRERGGRWKLMC